MKMREKRLTASVTASASAQVVALCITFLSRLWLDEKEKALRAVAAYFGYVIDKAH